ncbi:hypothetical protein [Actinocorallia sp. A-T 12471]|uniref:hypothetical protein n=1 Tax=Actinocorallia sp. A-T 12471 TaxID=3089813 RepID=UPI0029CBBBBE|nr:hypothetical protein [Actinocorallia sp. A-T 12471]MDX6744927.1 hypothetical protein [Actinocorallia sp. A-T 12471]
MASILKGAGLVGAAALAAAALSSPAHAATTVVDWDTQQPYTGPVTAELTGNLVISGGGTTTCSDSTLDGEVLSASTLSIDDAVVDTCSGTASSITPQGLSWGGTIASVTGGANITITGFSMRATVFGVNCTYGTTITIPATNPSGAGQATISLSGKTIPKTAGIFLCPSSATITTGVYELTGAGGVRLGVNP